MGVLMLTTFILFGEEARADQSPRRGKNFERSQPQVELPFIASR